MSKAQSDLASRRYVITINLGEEVGSRIYEIAKANDIAATVLVRLLLRKVLASRVGSIIDVTLEVNPFVPLEHQDGISQALP